MVYKKRSSKNVCWVAQLCLIVCNPMDCRALGSSVCGDSPGKNTGVGCHALLQGMFLTQGLNPDFQYYEWILYHLSHQGSPRILEWVAYPFSRGSSDPGIEPRSPGRFFTKWHSAISNASFLCLWGLIWSQPHIKRGKCGVALVSIGGRSEIFSWGSQGIQFRKWLIWDYITAWPKLRPLPT